MCRLIRQVHTLGKRVRDADIDIKVLKELIEEMITEKNFNVWLLG